MDKIDGKISEEFWQRKIAEWQLEEQQIIMAMQALNDANPDRLLTAKRTLELANKAYFLYVTQKPAEQAKLLKTVLSNCRYDGVSLYPTYRKSFDLIFTRAKSKEWRARRGSNLIGIGNHARDRRFGSSLRSPKRGGNHGKHLLEHSSRSAVIQRSVICVEKNITGRRAEDLEI